MKKNTLYIFQANVVYIFKNVANFELTENNCTFTFTKETTFSPVIASNSSVSKPPTNSKITIFSGGMFVELESSNSN